MKTITILKALSLMAGLMIAASGWGQGAESLDNSSLPGTYANGSFTGDNGFTWTYGHSRDEAAYPITVKGIMLRRASDSYLEAVIPGGIGNFSFEYRKAYTGISVRQLELIINGLQVATSPEFGPTEPDLTIYTFTTNNINVAGNVTVKIKNVGTTTTNRQTVIDNISWTGYTSGVTPPSISNINQTPETDITSTTTVSVSADITGGDAAIKKVELRWGTTSGDYPNTVTMTASVSKSVTYTTEQDIPAQADGTTVYYVVYAEDVDAESSTSPEHNIVINGGGAAPKNVSVSGAVFYDCGPLSFPFYEDFNYPVGSKLVDYCWSAHSAPGTNSVTVSEGSITYAGYLSSGIGNQVTLTNTGEDVNRQFLAQTSGTVFFSFLVNITNAKTAGDYFFHVGPTSIGTTFRGRIFVRKDTNDKLAFGVSQSSTSIVNYSDFDYDLNTTYLIVLRYEIIEGASNDVSSIYINPPLNMSFPLTGWISNTDASGTDLSELGTVALRQGNASNAAELKLDGIRVSNNWADIVGETSALVLLPDPTALSGFTYIEGDGPSAIQSFTLTGENLSENVVLTKPASYEISTIGGGSFTPEASITLIPVDGSVSADIYVRLQASLTVGTYNEDVLITWEGDNIQVGLSGSVAEAVTEPTAHVTNFAATANSFRSITVSWTDSGAEAYLIKGSTVDFNNIAAPVDGMPEADGGLVKNVASEVQSHEFTSLEASTEYFFKIFPYNGSGALINYKTDGEVPQINAATEALPNGYFVDFEGEGETKGSYSSGTVNLSGMDWNLTEALIGTLATDWKNGERSTRMRGYAASSITMLENKTGGIGEVSFFYRRYGTDAQVDWKVEYSHDNGNTWIQIGTDFTAPDTDDVQTFSEVVNAAGAIRIKIKRATEDGLANRRLNIDDILITDSDGVPENRTVIGITLGMDATECYDATNNITVTNTTIGNNASAEFRANGSINFGEGFVAESGSYVLAVITDAYCSLPESLLAS